jgi:3',5'-cyclic AMP phosphodiesterase CpdA
MIASREPEIVVLSGDLTQRAKPEQFLAARDFVDRIPVPTVVVPGNHDVPLYRVWERFFAPFGAYRRYFAEELEPIYRDDSLLLVGINTAHGLTLTGGKVRLRRLREVRDLFAATPESVCKIVVAHHHFVPPPRFGSQRVLRNSFEAIDLFSSAGVDLILSGHQHQAFIANSEEFYPKGRPPVVILHSGTTTSNRGRGVEEDRNTCNWIEVGPRRIQVSHLRWEPELDRFAEHSRHLYPRQEIHPYTLGEAEHPRSAEAVSDGPRDR